MASRPSDPAAGSVRREGPTGRRGHAIRRPLADAIPATLDRPCSHGGARACPPSVGHAKASHGNTDHGNTGHGNTGHGNTDHANTDHDSTGHGNTGHGAQPTLTA